MPERERNPRIEEGLERAARRLVQLIELKAPPIILAQQVAAAVGYAAALHPEAFGAAFGLMVGSRLAKGLGTCWQCGRDLDEKNVCPACQDEAEREMWEQGWDDFSDN
jgi:hypothetical protein